MTRPRDPRIDVGLPPRRELDSEKTFPRAGAPVGLIRRPLPKLPMKPVKQ